MDWFDLNKLLERSNAIATGISLYLFVTAGSLFSASNGFAMFSITTFTDLALLLAFIAQVTFGLYLVVRVIWRPTFLMIEKNSWWRLIFITYVIMTVLSTWELLPLTISLIDKKPIYLTFLFNSINVILIWLFSIIQIDLDKNE